MIVLFLIRKKTYEPTIKIKRQFCKAVNCFVRIRRSDLGEGRKIQIKNYPFPDNLRDIIVLL